MIFEKTSFNTKYNVRLVQPLSLYAWQQDGEWFVASDELELSSYGYDRAQAEDNFEYEAEHVLLNLIKLQERAPELWNRSYQERLDKYLHHFDIKDSEPAILANE